MLFFFWTIFSPESHYKNIRNFFVHSFQTPLAFDRSSPRTSQSFQCATAKRDSGIDVSQSNISDANIEKLEQQSKHTERILPGKKALILGCSTLHEVIDFHLQNGKDMAPYHLSLCWHKIAQMVNGDWHVKEDIKENASALLPLLKQTVASFDNYDARSLSGTAVSFSKISSTTNISFEPKIWSCLTKRAVQVKDFEAADISFLLCAYVRVNRKDKALLDSLSDKAMLDINNFDPKEMAHLVWGYAKLDYPAPARLYQAIERNAIKKLNNFTAEDIAKIVWAYATVDVLPTKLLNAIADLIIEKFDNFQIENNCTTAWWELDHYDAHKLCIIVWSYAKLGHKVPKLFQSIETEAIETLDLFFARDLTSIAYAYAKIGHRAPKLFTAIRDKAIRHVDTFNKQDIANIVWAYAKADQHAPQLFQAMEDAAIKELSLFTSRDIAIMIWAYAKVGHKAPTLCTALEEKAVEIIKTFNEQDVVNTLWGYARLGHAAPALFDAIQQVIVEQISRFTSHDITSIYTAYATIGYHAPTLFGAMYEKIEEDSEDFDEDQMKKIALAYLKLGISAPKLFDGTKLKALEELNEFISQENLKSMQLDALSGYPEIDLLDQVIKNTK